MPIHLPPISRRRFLARSLVFGSGLALAPKLLAVSRPTDPHSWALLSDTHLAADRALNVSGVNMAAHFESVSKELLSRPARPAGVVISGDCAYRTGEATDYETLAGLLAPLREDQMPIHLALGNHDHREHFRKAFAGEETGSRPLAGKQVSILSTPHANWFILDSLDQTAATPGLLGPEQLAWLASTLDANPDKPALVLVHHNPGIDGNMGLKDTVAFFETIRPRKQVKAYIYGHTHVWKVEQEASGLHLINLPPVAYVFQPGNPSGWVHATLEPNGMRLELRCIDTNHKEHGQTLSLKWRA
jgi:3',5'-cyclic AMP phosphodiesterase CpdA